MVWTEEEELLSSRLDSGELRPSPEVVEYFRGSSTEEEPRPRPEERCNNQQIKRFTGDRSS